jgi:two-component system NtrC family sensor kinase
MKIFLLFIFLCFTSLSIKAQRSYADSLRNVFQTAGENDIKVFALGNLSQYYSFLYPDSAMFYAEKLIEFSNKQSYLPGEALGYIYKGEALDRFARYPEALEAALHSLEIARTLTAHRLFMMGRSYSLIGHLYGITENQKEAIPYLHMAARFLEESGEYLENFYFTYFQLAYSMLRDGKADSALYYVKKGSNFFTNVKALRDPAPWLVTGNVYKDGFGNIDTAEYYFRKGIKLSEEFNALFLTAVLYTAIADIFHHKKEMDSCIYYLHKSLLLSQKYSYRLFEINASGFLAYIYDTINVDSAYKYIKIMVGANEEVFNATRGQQFQKAAFDAEKREKDLEDANAQFQNKIRIYGLITVLAFFVIIAIIFWRNNQHRKKANLLLSQQKNQLESTLSNLKSTQAQLIQSEKMASLGELTAGIAHEIQNPLNFVNNFSEVNTELLDELKSERSKVKGERNEEIEDEILTDVQQNLEKILHHGKRADAIVKGMLQHSRISTGQKEPTDINALVDEYLRLSYHGLRAKDKTFNATIQTDFDKSIEKINIVPQDIGRVLLNLFNNAFYAVSEKKKNLTSFENLSGLNNYEPTISVDTKKIGDKVFISVKDNGIGIPQKVVDKIFQPFFTTKPTGQGTGLGLSLSYDIIKAHGGEIKVQAKESEGAEFVIQLLLV